LIPCGQCWKKKKKNGRCLNNGTPLEGGIQFFKTPPKTVEEIKYNEEYALQINSKNRRKSSDIYLFIVYLVILLNFFWEHNSRPDPRAIGTPQVKLGGKGRGPGFHSNTLVSLDPESFLRSRVGSQTKG
jgi:hypothetical protein